jgi:hypothetical protein
MKFVTIKILFLISCLGISLSNVIKETSECDNPCQSCQRTVYQLKYQKMADCGSVRCRNTCEKIKENWNNVNNTWEPFLKDIFGKCEICFRAGFCKISECKVQEENELRVISQVVNASKLTAKTDDIIIKGNALNGDQGDEMFNDPDRVNKLNKIINDDKRSALTMLKAGCAVNDVKPARDSIKKLFDNFFTETFKSEGLHKSINSNDLYDNTLEAYRTFSAHVHHVLNLKKQLGAYSKPSIATHFKYSELVRRTLNDVRQKRNKFKILLTRLRNKNKKKNNQNPFANSILDCINDMSDLAKRLTSLLTINK